MFRNEVSVNIVPKTPVYIKIGGTLLYKSFLVCSKLNARLWNNYHAYATTVAEKQLQGADINTNKNFSLPNLIRQGSPYLGDPTTIQIF